MTTPTPSKVPTCPCPFCGGKCDPEGWLRNDGLRGPECEKCGATAPTIEAWNQRQPQPAREAVACVICRGTKTVMNRAGNGEVAYVMCPSCKGSGKEPKHD